MKAEIRYGIREMLHPWNEKSRKEGMKIMCLVKITYPQVGYETLEPVAIFNLDSEAIAFQGHCYHSPRALTLTPDMSEYFRNLEVLDNRNRMRDLAEKLEGPPKKELHLLESEERVKFAKVENCNHSAQSWFIRDGKVLCEDCGHV